MNPFFEIKTSFYMGKLKYENKINLYNDKNKKIILNQLIIKYKINC